MDNVGQVAEEGKPRRGQLRIYLGAAPGVGKTYAMLGEARRRADRGTDVVVGLVETYGRVKTAAMLDGLAAVPVARLSYRGQEFAELDTDAVLARAPEVVVVDELAHTNVPGSRNVKRWQDIEELLEAGITVLSTVNVQHLESLNDVVERITGIRQRETVPDEVVRNAEQVELVDITPEALRRRLAHGNVYPASKIDAALSNYFRAGNLTALRELALLWVADQVDVALQRYRQEKHITDTWEARERVVVAITGGPESETLIRRGSRIATRAGGELLVLHVLRGDGLAGVRPQTGLKLRKLADDVGASFHTVVGEDVPTALLDFARGANATQLVLGTSRRSRFARLFDEGIGASVVQRSGPIDVHMVTHAESGSRLRQLLVSRGLARTRTLLAWLLAVLLPAATTYAGATADLILSTDVVGYFLSVIVVVLIGGLWPALFAAACSVFALTYFFTSPYQDVGIDSRQDVVTVVAMLIAAVTVALVVDRASHRARQAANARTEAALLASYARTVLTYEQPVDRLLEQVRENFALDAVSLLERWDGHWRQVAAAGTAPCTNPDDADVDVPVTAEVRLALSGRPLPAEDRRVLEAAAGQALLALRQQRMAAEAAEAKRQAEATELRTALLSAVGHDLRTPLTSIKAAVGSLRDTELSLSAQDTDDLLATVEESADHLSGLVDNLLDSSRLATGTVRTQLRAVGFDDVVSRALSSVDGARAVVVDVDDRLPAVLADPGLLERVIANVVDNALRHGSGMGVDPVSVRASEYAHHVELRVADHGKGLPKDAADSAFAPFQRLGDRNATAGVGLGLSVAKGFTEAMGGTIRAEDTPGGGLTIVISLPAEEKSVTRERA
ncbi:two-component system sensor histidine kinase KdpD [Tamaricihabitans halophyticus]|uniref:histidine kinase n=1 Tax=Tamaricihabitans halophyticus TaxID=1262583 RepID=A0A4R2QSR9_9PSEU|nr:ATP-binding protein [Tamaricihabitans halophyticus]TCP52009.1 two-component system sensor histidine kinase KdpD [Tamaricihabitans halophyticus]